MRMIFKKRWGFALMAYPVDDNDGLLQGFRAGIYDDNRDLWWFSDDIVKDKSQVEGIALVGWKDVMMDFLTNQDEFPDRTQVIDVRNEIRAEIDAASFRINQMAAEIIVEEGIENDEPVQGTVDAGAISGGGGRQEAAGGGEAPVHGEVGATEEVHTEELQGSSEEDIPVPEQGVVDEQDSSEPEHEHLPSEESTGQEPRVDSGKESEGGSDGQGVKTEGGTGDSKGTKDEQSGGKGESE